VHMLAWSRERPGSMNGLSTHSRFRKQAVSLTRTSPPEPYLALEQHPFLLRLVPNHSTAITPNQLHGDSAAPLLRSNPDPHYPPTGHPAGRPAASTPPTLSSGFMQVSSGNGLRNAKISVCNNQLAGGILSASNYSRVNRQSSRFVRFSDLRMRGADRPPIRGLGECIRTASATAAGGTILCTSPRLTSVQSDRVSARQPTDDDLS
jgi:hypothetical protein